MKIFEQGLEDLVNRNSMENGSNTPDFVLAAYLRNCLIAFDTAVNRRDEWYAVTLAPGSSTAATHAPALAATQEEVEALVEELVASIQSAECQALSGDMLSHEDLYGIISRALLQRKGGAL